MLATFLAGLGLGSAALARAADRIELVDEDDAGCFVACLVEHLAHAGSADANAA